MTLHIVRHQNVGKPLLICVDLQHYSESESYRPDVNDFSFYTLKGSTGTLLRVEDLITFAQDLSTACFKFGLLHDEFMKEVVDVIVYNYVSPSLGKSWDYIRGQIDLLKQSHTATTSLLEMALSSSGAKVNSLVHEYCEKESVFARLLHKKLQLFISTHFDYQVPNCYN